MSAYEVALDRVCTSTDGIKGALAAYHRALSSGDYVAAQVLATDIENLAGQLALDAGVLDRYFAGLRGDVQPMSPLAQNVFELGLAHARLARGGR